MNDADSNVTPWNDQAIGVGITRILRGGVVISVLIVLLGSVAYLSRHGLEPFGHGTVPNEQMPLSDLKVVIHDALAGQGRAIMQLGLIVLIATPIARVAFSVFAFAKQKDRNYVIITTIVLAVLCFSLFAG